jgi:hypothetical protein
MKKIIKKFGNFITKNDLKIVDEKLNNMEIGLDLTNHITKEYVMQKTLEYLNESEKGQ